MNEKCYEWTKSGSKPISEFKKKLDNYRSQGKIIVTANGCFDIFHLGHLSLLTEAKSMGDILIVGVSSDRIVKKVKGPGRPIFPEQERAPLLSSLSCVDHAIVFDEILPNDFLEMIRPDIHCISSEHANKNLPEKYIVEKYGGKVQLLPYVSGHSTTNIIQKINQHKTTASAEALSSKGQETITDYLFESSTSIRCLAYQHSETLMRIAGYLSNAIKSNRKIILYGDGENSAYAQHFTEELNLRFSSDKKPCPAIALSGESLEDIGKSRDLLIILSTNGESKDFTTIGETAREIGIQIIAFIGNSDSPLYSICDEILSIDSQKTTIIQQGYAIAFNGILDLLDHPT